MELVNLLHDFALFSNARNALAMFDTDRDGKISFDEFCALNVRFPQVRAALELLCALRPATCL